jgi:hypothetical protein
MSVLPALPVRPIVCPGRSRGLRQQPFCGGPLPRVPAEA